MKTCWLLVLSVSAGFGAALLSGLVENRPQEVTIPENRYYGYPLIWRLFDPFTGENYYIDQFVVDC
ncbi:MAG: hypothetical protein QXJ02_07115, partial [Candidatus Bathyarchaeia archaeon]